MNTNIKSLFFMIMILAFGTLSSALNVDIPLGINYSLIPTVNNSDYLDGYDSSYFYPYSNPLGFISSITNIFNQWLNTTSNVAFNRIDTKEYIDVGDSTNAYGSYPLRIYGGMGGEIEFENMPYIYFPNSGGAILKQSYYNPASNPQTMMEITDASGLILKRLEVEQLAPNNIEFFYLSDNAEFNIFNVNENYEFGVDMFLKGGENWNSKFEVEGFVNITNTTTTKDMTVKNQLAVDGDSLLQSVEIDGTLDVAGVASLNSIKLDIITLPSCNSTFDGTIARNSTKLYYCDGSIWQGLY